MRLHDNRLERPLQHRTRIADIISTDTLVDALQLPECKHPREQPIEQSIPHPPSTQELDQRTTIPFPDILPITRPKPSPRPRTKQHLRHDAACILFVRHCAFLAVFGASLVFGIDRTVERIGRQVAVGTCYTGFDTTGNDSRYFDTAILSLYYILHPGGKFDIPKRSELDS